METESSASGSNQVVEKIAALATAAFGLVAALAWNAAIQEAFRMYFGEQSALTGLLIYAAIVTVVAVAVTIWIGRISSRAQSRLTRHTGGPGRPMA